MSDNKFQASIVISSEHMEAKELIKQLGEAETADKGDPISSRKGAKLRKDSIWMKCSTLAESEPLESQISELVTYLKQRSSQVVEVLRHSTIEIWCKISNKKSQCGFVISSGLIDELASLKINLVFDLYR
ncbi:MAG TPA: DUF4279 domain-containing protein [Frateuria sp.]|uniref:DUF4279 domain-containing protein n=1 Tax=Frateuria sp. TaxID=2211372 RepID=UPI002DEB651B|nr:DUF4279 domain-containing protein [Frateuria sp.]